jgi:predicted amidophosphoribosyltransferase
MIIITKLNLVLNRIMPENGIENVSVEKDEEKILYGVNKIICFACGEQIDKTTEICPYCKTPIT